MSRFLCVLLLALLPASLIAKEFNSEDETKAFTESVMKQVATGNLKGGFEQLSAAYTAIPKVEVDGIVSQALLQVPVMEARFGKSIGHEFVSENRVGSSVVRYAYLQKFEKHAIVWQFVFYRPTNSWILNSFKFTDSALGAL